MRIKAISIYIDFKTDESYTPKNISLKVANSFFETQEVKNISFMEPSGWYTFYLDQRNANDIVIKPYIKTMFV